MLNLTSEQDWHIIGAGSIGCLWAAHLSQARARPTLILRPERFNEFQDEQPFLKMKALDGSESSHPITITTGPLITQPIKKLLVCTKAGDALAAVQSVQDQLGDDCDIVLLQNGMGSQQAIYHHFQNLRVWAASTTDGAWLRSPLDVCHAGKGVTWIGRLDHHQNDTQHPLIKSFESFPLNVQHTRNIKQKLWTKLAINCAINGLTALHDCTNGGLIQSQKISHQMTHLINEAENLLKALNISIECSLHEKVHQVCQGTANNYSSTCMDARLGRTTELAYVNGFLIEQATLVGLQLPAHQKLMSDLAEKNVRW